MYTIQDAIWDAVETGRWVPPIDERTRKCPYCGDTLADDELCCCDEAIEAEERGL